MTLPADAGDTVTAEDLDRYAKARWEVRRGEQLCLQPVRVTNARRGRARALGGAAQAVLHFMLRIDQETRPSNDVVHLLERAQLILSKAERRDRWPRCCGCPAQGVVRAGC